MLSCSPTLLWMITKRSPSSPLSIPLGQENSKCKYVYEGIGIPHLFNDLYHQIVDIEVTDVPAYECAGDTFDTGRSKCKIMS